MSHVFCLGPLRTEDGKRSYCCLAAGGAHPGMATGKTKLAALEALVAQGHTEGAVCEEGLDTEARKLGLQVAPLPESLVELKAAMAVGMDHGDDLGGPEQMPMILDLLHAAADFDEVLPWELFDSEVPLTLHVKGAHPRTLEACVLGSGREQYGLAIYFEPGSVERLMDEGPGEAAARVDSLALLLEDEPEYIAEAVEDATGGFFAPLVLRVRQGKPVAVSTEELALLVAALRAVAALSVDRSEGWGESTEGPRIRVRAREHGRGPREAQGVAAAAWGTVGRNEPCPCGSGQKFKRCHGGASARAAPPPGRSRWHAVDERLVQRLGAFATARFPDAGAGTTRALYGEHPPTAELLVPWSVYEYPVEGRPIAQHFLEEHRGNLGEEERQWLEAQLAAHTSLHEVLEVRPGEGLELLDLFTGERASVHEVSASRMLAPRHAVVGRVTRMADEQVVAGMHPAPLPPEEADEVLEKLGGGLTTGQPPRPTPPAAGELVQAWCAAVEAYERKSREPSVLKNTDGDPFMLLEDRFNVRKDAREELVDLLAGLEGASVDEDKAKGTSLTFTRPGNPVHSNWTNTVVGTARVTPATLVLSTNSEKRADALRARVEAAAGALLTFTSRKRIPTPEVPGGRDILLDAQNMPGVVEAEALEEEAYRAWLDTPLPSLGGARPRERVGDPEGRIVVHRLLRAQENEAARSAKREVAQVLALRRELGLDALGQPLPHHDLDVALGAGRKISEGLLDVAQPLLDRGPGTPEYTREVLRVAADAWNAAVADAQDPDSHEVLRMRGHLAREGFEPADFDLLLARKQQRHGSDLRRVESWELVGERGRFTVVALGSVSKDLARRARDAGIAPPLAGANLGQGME